VPTKERSSSVVSYPCLKFVEHDQTILLLTAPAKELFRILAINKRDPDKRKGYQRALSQSRIAQIARFIDSGEIMPTALVVSLEHAHLKDRGRTVEIEDRPDAGWVIDGQHRLAGASEAQMSITFPVVAFLGLPLENQIRQFITINKEAKGVPSSL